MSFRFTVLALTLYILPYSTGLTEETNSCIKCHRRATPLLVEQHLEGRMAKAGVGCEACHGSEHNDLKNANLAKMPTADTCAGCHSEKAKQFRSGKHNLAWIAATSMPMMAHQPASVTGEGYKGCSNCHKIGEKSEKEKSEIRYGHAQCDACHTRHSFKKSEALDPRACQTCHMGFDHPQWEMWSTSKHGTIWQIEGADKNRAPTCQTCHMHKGDHQVLTSWGFLALRLPEDDKQWQQDRTTILQALGILDAKGLPTPRYDLIKTANAARLDKQTFDEERKKMQRICAKCHSRSYAKSQLESADQVVRDADKVMAEAVRIVQKLYDDKVLKKPDGWTYAPDILQFYEAKSDIEQELYVMFMEYRMRAIQGAFHFNPDYMHWYGWARLKKSLQQIKSESAKLRTVNK